MIHIVVPAVLAAACAIGPAATPGPVGSPPPTEGPTASPGPSPTPSFGSEQISHPTGATDVVLRMEQGGGFVPMEWMVTQAPQFTLYGDGTVIFRPQDDAEVGDGFEQGLPRFLTGKMTEEGIQALLHYALATGRLATAHESYENPMIADASTTVFVLNAGGVEKVVSVYALSEVFEPGPDAADRQAFAQLQQLLMNFEQEADAGTVQEVRLYDAVWYRVVMFEGPGEPVRAPIEWPWADIAPADFPAGDEPGRTKLLSSEHVGELTELPSGGHMSIWVETPDGELVSFALRPLLPDEVAGLEL